MLDRQMGPSLSAQEADVLAAILETPSEVSYGYKLARLCSAPTGSIYKVLSRLEVDGLVCSEDEPRHRAESEGRPQRRLYSLTGSGEAALALWRARRLRRSASSRLLR
jgi:DNA-binding PadR family transcriptional regulator